MDTMKELVGLGFTTSDARTGERLQVNVTIAGGDDLNFTAASCGDGADKGFVFANVGKGHGAITLSKPGYQTRVIDCEFPTPPNLNYALTPSAAARPTRDQVTAVKACFGASWDSADNVIFDPAWVSLRMRGSARAAEWLQKKAADGISHMVASTVLRYASHRVDGQLCDYDLQDDLPTFLRFLNELLDAGRIPVVYLTNGDPADEERVWDGRFRAACRELASVNTYCVWLSGWENFGLAPSWSSAAIFQSLKIMREEFGATAVLAAHVNSSKPGRCTWASHPVQTTDPSAGAEQPAHYYWGGEECNLYFYQTCYDNESPVYAIERWREGRYDGPEAPWNRWPECLVRFVPHGTFIPAYNLTTSDNSGPDWFALPRAQGREQMVIWEPGVPYAITHPNEGPLSVDQLKQRVREVSDFFKDCGVPQGCYVK